MIPTTLLLAVLVSPTNPSEHPLNIAQETCKDHGGVAMYIHKDNVVEFSCSEDLSKVYTIVLD